MNQNPQIKLCESCISKLEERRRTGAGDLSKLDQEIQEAYQQLALLKIRQSMNLAF